MTGGEVEAAWVKRWECIRGETKRRSVARFLCSDIISMDRNDKKDENDNTGHNTAIYRSSTLLCSV